MFNFRLPECSAKDVIKVLQKHSYEVLRSGNHIILRHTENGNRVSVPSHKKLKTGTLRAIINQAGLTRDQFILAL